MWSEPEAVSDQLLTRLQPASISPSAAQIAPRLAPTSAILVSVADDDLTYSHENEKQRLDRELVELINEVRVALPGVQVLFAFLLAVPFQGGWADVTTLQERAYFTALVGALIASTLLISPSALHRVNFRAGNKERIVRIANALTFVGLLVLAVAMSAAMLLVTDVIFSTRGAVMVSAGASIGFVLMWVVLPYAVRRAD